MTKIIVLLVGVVTLGLAACGPSGTNCNCVSVAACPQATSSTTTCGTGLVCCPALPDGGH